MVREKSGWWRNEKQKRRTRIKRQYGKAMSVAVVAAGLLVAGRALAGSLDPTNAPGPTLHTLEEIYQKVNAFVSPQTLSATSAVVKAGYYAATNLTQVDTDLAAGNIKTNVTIFGIVGTHGGRGMVYTNAGAAVPKTGQTTSYRAGDDGYYTNGVAWPNPRFTVYANTNVVKDNLTGLMWARNANRNGYMMRKTIRSRASSRMATGRALRTRAIRTSHGT